MTIRKALFLSFAAVFVAGVAIAGNQIPNWSAPAFWTPSKPHGVTTASESNPVPFQALSPCRILDTRGTAGVPINTGGPFGTNETRTYTITGLCGLPATAVAVSVNFTVTSTVANPFGYLGAGPGGTPVNPFFSILNWSTGGVTESNAAVVPVSGAGTISIETFNAGAQVIMDVNGFYRDFNSVNLLAPGEHFEIAGNSVPPFGIINGRNNSTATNARGLLGISDDLSINSTPWTHAAVRGEAVSGNGVMGLTNNIGSCGVIGSQYDGAGVQIDAGLLGCDGVALEAFQYQAAGVRYAITGGTSNTTILTAGVRGNDGASSTTNTAWFSSGLLGLGKNGVIGFTTTATGAGVVGTKVTTSGATVTAGVLGTGFPADHGVWATTGDIGCTSCVKAFVDPHPTDPSKEIRFISLEGNEAGTYFRGTAETVGRTFVIQVPEDFRLVTDPEGLTVQLTPVGAPATMYVESEDLNQIVVHASRDVKFHYLVHGIRASFKDAKTIIEMADFLPQTPDGRMPEGWAELAKQRLIANGTYNKDGTLNMETMERLGWAQKWRDMEEAARVRAESARAEAASPGRRGGKDN